MKNRTVRKSLLVFSFLIGVFSIASLHSKAQSKNLVLVTIDGLRWQELFNGADSFLLFNSKYISQDSAHIVQSYWANSRAREEHN